MTGSRSLTLTIRDGLLSSYSVLSVASPACRAALYQATIYSALCFSGTAMLHFQEDI